MTDRVRTSMDGSAACPFIAFDDERDERSTEPDHAHRCYAEVRPAPRALAHQEAYCLSSAFPVCPTFQAWARRESARARGSDTAGAAAAGGATAGAAVAKAADAGADAPLQEPRAPETSDQDDLEDGSAASGSPSLFDDDLPARRNPPRDWAAPPPWAAGAAAGAAAPGGAGSGGRAGDEPPDFLTARGSEGKGLAGSAADRLAGGEPIEDVHPATAPSSSDRGRSVPADPELAGLVGGAAYGASGGSSDHRAVAPPTKPGKRPTVSSTRDKDMNKGPVLTGPAWEESRRYEAYPTIQTRTGLPGIPRVVLIAGALGVAAIALFFLPALLGVGGSDPGASPSASASFAVESASPVPTTPPPPTPQVYIVKSGDSLSKIARSFGLTLDQLLEANPAIKDPNKISVGDEIIIPTPPPEEIVDPSAEASP